MSIRLLVVEDDADLADFVVRGFREEGFIVDHLADGLAAWHAIQGSSWDIVVLDYWLLGQDGLSVLRKMRQAKITTPVLFLTARDSVEDRVEGLNAGADDYLGKPFAFSELLARVYALLRRHANLTATRLEYADVRVDVATQRAERAGQPLNLTNREQSLLVFFLRHAEAVLTRTRLYESVWDERYDGLSNTLEVHVMELRRKLEAHGPRLIHTVRGRGYVLSKTPYAPEKS
jgi:DNA-binding response OmpR family regulator